MNYIPFLFSTILFFTLFYTMEPSEEIRSNSGFNFFIRNNSWLYMLLVGIALTFLSFNSVRRMNDSIQVFLGFLLGVSLFGLVYINRYKTKRNDAPTKAHNPTPSPNPNQSQMQCN